MIALASLLATRFGGGLAQEDHSEQAGDHSRAQKALCPSSLSSTCHNRRSDCLRLRDRTVIKIVHKFRREDAKAMDRGRGSCRVNGTWLIGALKVDGNMTKVMLFKT